MNQREGILALFFFSWWYNEQFRNVLKYLRALLAYLTDLFSVQICLKTLFSVWRRDKIYYDGLSLTQRLEAATLNFASRLVGFIVKTITLISYAIIILASIIFFVVFIIFWLAFPMIIVAIIYYGILNILTR